MPAGYGSLARLRQIMIALGARRLVAKRLADNDNSKNQIYLGSDFEVLNVLPFGDIYEDSSDKNQILKASLDFHWLMPDGTSNRAPGTQLILYPQYPEVRMSGFLRGARDAPRDLMTVRKAGRVLFLGIDNNGRITAAVVSPEDALAREFEAVVGGLGERVFYELSLGVPVEDTRALLIAELRRIHRLGWIRSKRLLANGELGPCEAPNCGGYTLEAELGVKPNGFSEPDYLGWEIKQHGVNDLNAPARGGSITLMTPEPTGGFYAEHGAEAFIRKYGYQDRHGREDRINFGGVHRVGIPVGLTGMTLTLDGFDAVSGKLDSSKGITLRDAKGQAAAVWYYSGIMKHWARKHARAAYVPSAMRADPDRQYRYGGTVLLAQDTDFLRFLNAMASGNVYYDPGIKLEGASTLAPRTKRRSQFRIRLKNLPILYASTERLTL